MFPLSQQQEKEQEEQEPTPKSKKGGTRSLKFNMQTTLRLLAEFRGLGVRMTRVTRRTRATRRTSPKFTITEHRNLFVTYLDLKSVFEPNFFFTLKIFWTKIFVGPEIF